MDRRLDRLKILRGLAAMAVLASHLAEHHLAAFGTKLLPGLSLGWAGVDLFFVLSGFIIARSAYDRAPSLASAGRFALSRGARIYLPWWVALGATLALAATAPALLSYHGTAPLLASLFLLPADGQPFLGVGWTLVMEVAFYGVFALLLLVPVVLRGWLLGLWGALIVALAFVPAVHGTAAGHLIANPLCLEFLAGVALARWIGPVTTAKAARTMGLLALGGAVAMAVGAVGVSQVIEQGRLAEWVRAMAVGGPATVVVGALAALDLGRLQLGGRLVSGLVGLGDRSYALYLVHFPIVSAVAFLVAGLIVGPAGMLAFLTLSLVLCALATETLHRWVERPAIGLSRKLGRTPWARSH